MARSKIGVERLSGVTFITNVSIDCWAKISEIGSVNG
jgi:hypothetical protein